jgi:hypothetical protein
VFKISIEIHIDEKLYKDAEKIAGIECRTVPLQIMFWAKIGKAALEHPDLPTEFIRDAVIAQTQNSEPFEFREPKK